MFNATIRRLWDDEGGFLVSAELALIGTIAVIGVIVGLAEVQNAVVNELNDVGEAIGSLNQSFYFHGHTSFGGFGGFGGFCGGGFCGGGSCGFGGSGRLKASTPGSMFVDRTDAGDLNECAISCSAPVAEVPKFYGPICQTVAPAAPIGPGLPTVITPIPGCAAPTLGPGCAAPVIEPPCVDCPPSLLAPGVELTPSPEAPPAAPDASGAPETK